MISINRRYFIQVLVSAGSMLSARRVLAQGRKKVVIIGGGVGGITAARTLLASHLNIDVTVIEPNAFYTTCFFSGSVLAGFQSRSELDFSYRNLKNVENIAWVQARADHIDADKSVVRLSTGDVLSYDRLIVAPGIGFQLSAIEGYSETASFVFPHAYDLGHRIDPLKARLEALDDGALLAISIPERPYRCTPAPYERASMIAHYLKTYKPKSKVIILDSKNEFPLMDRILPAWERFYGDMIEWVPADFGGKLDAVNVADGSISAGGEIISPALANIIPPQRAGDIALTAGLVDKSGWCPVDTVSLESTLIPKIHVIGDAIEAGDMSKSADSAASHGYVCGAAVGQFLTGEAPTIPEYENACYFLVAQDHGLKVGGSYTPKSGRIVGTKGFSSAVGETDAVRKVTAFDGVNWYQQTTQKLFG